jgi:hypothetical protein
VRRATAHEQGGPSRPLPVLARSATATAPSQGEAKKSFILHDIGLDLAGHGRTSDRAPARRMPHPLPGRMPGSYARPFAPNGTMLSGDREDVKRDRATSDVVDGRVVAGRGSRYYNARALLHIRSRLPQQD